MLQALVQMYVNRLYFTRAMTTSGVVVVPMMNPDAHARDVDRDTAARHCLHKIFPGFDPIVIAKATYLPMYLIGTQPTPFIYPSDAMFEFLHQFILCIEDDPVLKQARGPEMLNLLQRHLWGRECCHTCVLKRSCIIL